MPMNHQIVYQLQDVMSLLPDFGAGAGGDGVGYEGAYSLTKGFTENTNDQLLVVYLSSLIRAVIALHALVDNKASIGRAEMEEGESGKDKEKEKEKEKKGGLGKKDKEEDKDKDKGKEAEKEKESKEAKGKSPEQKPSS